MPRSRHDYNIAYANELFDIANLKSYSTDLIPDYAKILKCQLNLFADIIEDSYVATMTQMMQKLACIKMKRTYENRTYIVIGPDHLRLVMFNMDDCVLDNMADLLPKLGQILENQVEEGKPNAAMLYIFKGTKLFLQVGISSLILSELLISFQNENLINAGAIRDDWFAKPRKQSRILHKASNS